MVNEAQTKMLKMLGRTGAAALVQLLECGGCSKSQIDKLVKEEWILPNRRGALYLSEKGRNYLKKEHDFPFIQSHSGGAHPIRVCNAYLDLDIDVRETWKNNWTCMKEIIDEYPEMAEPGTFKTIADGVVVINGLKTAIIVPAKSSPTKNIEEKARIAITLSHCQDILIHTNGKFIAHTWEPLK